MVRAVREMKLTAGQVKAIETADIFCDANIDEHQIKHWVETRGMPSSIDQQIRQGSTGSYVLPICLGGKDLPILERITFLEQMTRRAGATIPLLSDMTALLMLSTMRQLSQQEIIEELVSRGGRIAFSEAFSEVHAGSDASAVRTTVSVNNKGISLDGKKTFVSGGQFMPELLVLARDPIFGGADGGLSLWLVPVDIEGVSTFPLNTIGQEMLSPALIEFRDVHLDPAWQIQTEGKLDSMLKRQYELGRILVCASSLGLAEAAYDDAISYAMDHTIKGRTMSSLPSIQEKIVSMAGLIRIMRMYVYDAAASAAGEQDSFHLDCALMKRFVPGYATDVSSMALQVFGGRGYTDETRVGRIWRDCRGNQIAQGTDEIMTHIAAKFLMS